MTDNSGIPAPLSGWLGTSRGWQSVLAAGLVVATAATVVVVRAASDPAAADTVVTAVTAAIVAMPDGTEHDARIGDRLPRGATLRTGPQGGARLTTAGRDVYVGTLSTIGIVDGVHERLDRGLVMVDSRSGPRLVLDLARTAVTTKAGSLTRIERGAVLRVGVYSGGATVSVAGRQATTDVPALYQVSAQYAALPAAPTALVLAKDTTERRLAAALTGADDDLNRDQLGLRGPEGQVVLATFRQDLVASATDAAADADTGERALSVAVAEVATASSDPLANLATIRTARSEGGSWGVVAAIVRASVDAVHGRLNRSLDDGSGGTVDAGPSVGPGVLGPLPGLSPTPSAPQSPGPRPTVTRSPGGGGSTPTATPSSAVDQLLETVRRLLPTPLPTVVAPLLTPPKVSPTPLVHVGGITVG